MDETKENIMKSQKAVMSQITSYYFFPHIIYLYWVKFKERHTNMYKPYLKLYRDIFRLVKF